MTEQTIEVVAEAAAPVPAQDVAQSSALADQVTQFIRSACETLGFSPSDNDIAVAGVLVAGAVAVWHTVKYGWKGAVAVAKRLSQINEAKLSNPGKLLFDFLKDPTNWNHDESGDDKTLKIQYKTGPVLNATNGTIKAVGETRFAELPKGDWKQLRRMAQTLAKEITVKALADKKAKQEAADLALIDGILAASKKSA